MKLILFLVVALAILVAGDPCRLASQQQAAMPAQAPEVAELPAQAPAICECGPDCQCAACACNVQSVAAVTVEVAEPPIASTYSLVYQMCVRSKVPLVVGVGFEPPAAGTYHTVQTRASNFFEPGKIVVSAPKADGMYWVATLPANATAADIQAALQPAPVQQTYQPQQFGGFQGMQGGCANGQCGMQFGGMPMGGCAGGQCGAPAMGMIGGGFGSRVMFGGGGCAGGRCR